MKTRICTKCNTEKHLNTDNFPKHKRYKEGFSTWCKACHKTASEKSRRVCSERDPDYHKNNALKHKHHVTPEQYLEKLREQEGHCALCPSTASNSGDRLSVDHDHIICPGKYACDKCRRGLLCSTCNARLGYLEQLLRDFPDPTRDQAEIYLRNSAVEGSWTKKALRYLKSYDRTQYEYIRSHTENETQETQNERNIPSSCPVNP